MGAYFEKSAGKLLRTKYFKPVRLDVSWLSGTWSLFTFPDEGNFNANSILAPGWKVYFYQTGTSIVSPVASNSSGTTLHSSPVKLDRYGKLPTIYINTLNAYDISVRNQYDIERHLIENLTA